MTKVQMHHSEIPRHNQPHVHTYFTK